MELIDRKPIIEYANGEITGAFAYPQGQTVEDEKAYREKWELVRYVLLSAPTIKAEPVKHGRWIKNEGRSGWHCSCCGKDNLYAYPYTENNERELQDFYCPNCGARMDLDEVEE